MDNQFLLLVHLHWWEGDAPL